MIKSKSKRSLRQVILLDVFSNHALSGELRHEGDHRMSAFLDPSSRNALLVSVEEIRDHLFGERLEKFGAVRSILLLDRIRVRIFANTEAILAVISFAPPAVE